MRLIASIALAFALAGPALAAQPTAKKASTTEEKHEAVPTAEQQSVRATYRLAKHMEEVGRIGARDGSNAQIKGFGKDVETEYGKLAAELEHWSDVNHVSLAGAAPERYRGQVQTLEGKKGTEFDRALVDMVAREDRQAVADIDRITSQSLHKGFKDEMVRARTTIDRFSREAERLGGKAKGV